MTIPRCFHSVWVGDPMPDHLAEYVKTWTRVHPSWEHRVWGDADLGWLQNQSLYDFAEAITRHTGQFRSDVARYEILHRFGGVYVDADFEALQPRIEQYFHERQSHRIDDRTIDADFAARVEREWADYRQAFGYDSL